MGKTILYVLNPERYLESIIRIFKKDIRGRPTIYVSTNKPYTHLVESFNKANVDAKKIFFIDCISREVGEMKAEPENALFIDTPQNLTAMSIAISESVKHLRGNPTLFLDSLSTLLLYHDANTIGRFSNFLINKMRVSGVDTIILALESDMDKEVLRKIETIADEVKR